MKSISVVCNARLTSTRVPRKLIRPFGGSTLIEIALSKLDRMDFFEHRYLAAAEHPLLELAEGYENVEVLQRDPASVVAGTNPMEVSFAHYLHPPSDYIFVFNPCLPLFSVSEVRKAYDYFQSTDFPSYTSAIPTREWIFDSDGHALTNRDPMNTSTTAGAIFYKGAHAFHILRKAYFAETGCLWTFSPGDPHLVPVPPELCIDVDHELDFELAELHYARQSASDS